MRAVVLWILQILSAVLLMGPAWSKITSSSNSIELFQTLGMEPYGRFIIGIIECGAILCLLLPKMHTIGALMSVSIMIGALIAHTTHLGFGDNPMGIMMVVNLISSSLILYLRKDDLLNE